MSSQGDGVLAEAGVPATPIYDATGMTADPHFTARGAREPHIAQ